MLMSQKGVRVVRGSELVCPVSVETVKVAPGPIEDGIEVGSPIWRLAMDGVLYFFIYYGLLVMEVSDGGGQSW